MESMAPYDGLMMLKELGQSRDYEVAHYEADKILCRVLLSFDCEELVEEFNKLTKWYA